MTVVDGPVDDRVLAAEPGRCRGPAQPGRGRGRAGRVVCVGARRRRSGFRPGRGLRPGGRPGVVGRAGRPTSAPWRRATTWRARRCRCARGPPASPAPPAPGAADRWLDLLERPALPALGAHAAGGRPEAGRHRATAEAVVPAPRRRVAGRGGVRLSRHGRRRRGHRAGGRPRRGPAPASAPGRRRGGRPPRPRRRRPPGRARRRAGRTVGALTVPVPVALAPGAGGAGGPAQGREGAAACRSPVGGGVRRACATSTATPGRSWPGRRRLPSGSPACASPRGPSCRDPGRRRRAGTCGAGPTPRVPGAPGRPLTVAVTLRRRGAPDVVGRRRRRRGRPRPTAGGPLRGGARRAGGAGRGRAGGRTPSDLPLVRSTRRTLDRIEAAVPEPRRRPAPDAAAGGPGLPRRRRGRRASPTPTSSSTPSGWRARSTPGASGPRPPRCSTATPTCGPASARRTTAGSCRSSARRRRGGVARRRPRRPRPRRAGAGGPPCVAADERDRGVRPGRRARWSASPCCASTATSPPGAHLPPRRWPTAGPRR